MQLRAPPNHHNHLRLQNDQTEQTQRECVAHSTVGKDFFCNLQTICKTSYWLTTFSLFPYLYYILQLWKAAKIVFLTTKNCILTSQPFLYTVVRCERISLPESPRKWIILLAEWVVPAVLEWFAVHLIVMFWKDVWLCNRRNLSWTTSTPAYSNCQRQKPFIISLRKWLTDVRCTKCSSINPQMCYLVFTVLLTKPLDRCFWFLLYWFPT